MNHRETLLAELREHGRVTYPELLARYGGRGYTYRGFQAAVVWARRMGIVAPAYRGSGIVRASVCPCCNRPFDKERA